MKSYSSNLKFFLILSFFAFLFIRCDDDLPRFPYVRVDETFNIATQLNNLQVDQYIQLEGYGLGGLIIYRESRAVFRAYDAACTYETSSECVLEENKDFNIFTCPCCGSSFFIYQDGNVFNGPARRPLKEYKADYIAPSQVHVYNY